ncbi:Cytochrome c oxidase assembly factor 6 protein [Rutstroemia sp. NJR-2017a BVV2]|nr:Cytochrome c oxidase assembly factor 6 protein [Rutstroemia sp. NJR-2017a BVV2]
MLPLLPASIAHSIQTDTPTEFAAMGLFGSAQASLPPPKIGPDGAPIAPDRSQRSRCWEARDAYFKCLDKAEIIDSLTDKDKAEKACSAEGRAFEGNCATSWVQYFKKRRVMEYQREQTLQRLKAEGAQQMPGQIGPPAPGQRP